MWLHFLSDSDPKSFSSHCLRWLSLQVDNLSRFPLRHKVSSSSAQLIRAHRIFSKVHLYTYLYMFQYISWSPFCGCRQLNKLRSVQTTHELRARAHK